MPNDANPIKLIVFSIATYRFALPLDQVLRVVNYPNPADNPLQSIGLIHLGRHVVKVLNLHQLISVGHSTDPAKPPALEPPSFLLLLASPHGELYGIPLDHPPDVVECTATQIQRLPQSHHPSHAIERLSHAVIHSAESPHSPSPSRSTALVFLLDPQFLVRAIALDAPLALQPASPRENGGI
ncbi:chemotaxis protein CheW [Egbenema bharatensis]|uniref:chemotaxis protein CheW n=1 Tax=Egbenema bharatensis TaxID=3463334 RepID=UPI003A85977C